MFLQVEALGFLQVEAFSGWAGRPRSPGADKGPFPPPGFCFSGERYTREGSMTGGDFGSKPSRGRNPNGGSQPRHRRVDPEPRRPRASRSRARAEAGGSLSHVDDAPAVAAEVVVVVQKVRVDRGEGLAGAADAPFFGLTLRISRRILTIASRRDARPHSLFPPSRTSRRLMRLARSSSDSTLRRRSIRTQIASFSTASLDVTNSRASCQQSSKSSSSPASDIVFMDSPAHVG